MTVDITVPALGESVTEATVMRWNKAPGDAVAVDETLVELETDKIAIEVKAEAAGTPCRDRRRRGHGRGGGRAARPPGDR